MDSDEEYEYQRSSLKVEVLMNLIYLGLFNDVDKERVMENFSPFPSGLSNKGGCHTNT
jgi:hypothetical protein